MEKDIVSIKINNLKSQSSLLIRERIERVANLKNSLLLIGETGVGKDFWAEYILYKSNYDKFVNLHCGDVPESLLYSEWFGYKKGAFTGADSDYEGKWAKADGGILFLNQIDLLSINLQARLLRIIERKKYFPLGCTREREIDVKFIFSVDNDIEERVKNGTFRADLFYRISPFIVNVLPLRERKEDVFALLKYFATKNRIGLSLSDKGIKIINNYNWMGNIRELENFVNRAAVINNSVSDKDAFTLVENSDAFLNMEIKQEKTLKDLEYEYIKYLIKKYKNKSKVSEILNISRKSLYDKIARYESDNI